MTSANAELTRKIPRSQRCSAERKSQFVSLTAARNILAGAEYARQVGRPLNRYVSIHWDKGGAGEGYAPTRLFLKLAGDWLATNGIDRTWVWARETGHLVGNHIHIAMHVPPSIGRQFGYRQRGWLKLAGAQWKKRVIKTRAIGRSSSHAFRGVQCGETYEYHLRRSVEYLLKGADIETARALGLTHKRKSGGCVVGKRAGTSENIGEAARSSGLIEG